MSYYQYFEGSTKDTIMSDDEKQEKKRLLREIIQDFLRDGLTMLDVLNLIRPSPQQQEFQILSQANLNNLPTNTQSLSKDFQKLLREYQQFKINNFSKAQLSEQRNYVDVAGLEAVNQAEEELLSLMSENATLLAQKLKLQSQIDSRLEQYQMLADQAEDMYQQANKNQEMVVALLQYYGTRRIRTQLQVKKCLALQDVFKKTEELIYAQLNLVEELNQRHLLPFTNQVLLENIQNERENYRKNFRGFRDSMRFSSNQEQCIKQGIQHLKDKITINLHSVQNRACSSIN